MATFSTVKIVDKTNKSTGIYFKINNKLSNCNSDNFKQLLQQISESGTRRETSTDGRQYRHTSTSNGQISKKP